MPGLFFVNLNWLFCTLEYNSQFWLLTFWSKHLFESALLFQQTCTKFWGPGIVRGSFFLWHILVSAFRMYNKWQRRLTSIQPLNCLIPSPVLVMRRVFALVYMHFSLNVACHFINFRIFFLDCFLFLYFDLILIWHLWRKRKMMWFMISILGSISFCNLHALLHNHTNAKFIVWPFALADWNSFHKTSYKWMYVVTFLPYR